jgi:type VI protein secretion system component Hcp
MPIWLTIGHFETRGELYPRFSGGVTVGAQAGRSKLESIEFLAPTPAGGAPAARERGAPGANEIVVTKLPDAASPALFKVCAQGYHIAPEQSGIAATIDFTRADGKGGEATELSVMLHGVVMERDNKTPRGGAGAAAERYRIRYKKMTEANQPPSSPDVSHAVKAALMREAGSTASAGGVSVGMMDGSVRLVNYGVRPSKYNWSYVLRRPRP